MPSGLSDEEWEKTLNAALKRMILIDGKVYGLEDESDSDAFVDCGAHTGSCLAHCCKYVFALTKEEVEKNIYKYNHERPYYMAKDEDGYCTYLDRETYKCTIHNIRPIRCRKFACKL